MQRIFATVGTLVAGAAVTGPFGTFAVTEPLLRAGYWLLAIAGVVALVNSALFGPTGTCDRIPSLLPRPIWRIVVAVAIAAPLGGAWINWLEVQLFGSEMSLAVTLHRASFVGLIALVGAIFEYNLRPRHVQKLALGRGLPEARGVAARDLAQGAGPYRGQQSGPRTGREAPGSVANTDAAPPRPLFLRTPEPELSGALVSVSVEDHYLDIVTEDGSNRILKRMADALAELEGHPGLQIHRSHWVSLDAITDLEQTAARRW